MARLSRAEFIDPIQVTVVHVICRTVRRCFLLGDDPISGKNFDHRRVWIEELLDWTARQIVVGKSGTTPMDTPPVLQRLGSLPALGNLWPPTSVRFKLARAIAARAHRQLIAKTRRLGCSVWFFNEPDGEVLGERPQPRKGQTCTT